MRCLYIDTTSNHLYSAIADDDKILSEIKLQMDKDLSVFALREISKMFSENNLIVSDIDKILVVNGPGSFTGIRVGITIAKTYAWGLKKEISTITSLEAMAVSSKLNTTFKVPIIDARRGYVFTGIYDDENNQVFKNQYIELNKLKSVLEALPGSYSIITNDTVEIDGNIEKYNPNFSEIVLKYKDKENINPHMVNPDYLKLTEAEEKKLEELV